MPKLIERFTLDDLPSKKGKVYNPISMDSMFSYRTARPPFREDHPDKTLTHDELGENFSNAVKSEYSARLCPMQQRAYTSSIRGKSKINLMSIIKKNNGGNT